MHLTYLSADEKVLLLLKKLNLLLKNSSRQKCSIQKYPCPRIRGGIHIPRHPLTISSTSHSLYVSCRWEEEKHPEGIKWLTLEHKGPYFPPVYEPLPDDVNFYYNGKSCTQKKMNNLFKVNL